MVLLNKNHSPTVTPLASLVPM